MLYYISKIIFEKRKNSLFKRQTLYLPKVPNFHENRLSLEGFIMVVPFVQSGNQIAKRLNFIQTLSGQRHRVKDDEG